MSPMKPALLLLLSARTVAGSCVNMKKFTNTDCSGATVQDVNFTGLNAPGSECQNWGALSVKDQYCDIAGTFKQKVFAGPGCWVGPVASQEFESGICKWGIIFSCDAGAHCSTDHSRSKATVTLLKYGTADCSDEPSKVEFSVGSGKESQCFDQGTYSVKDQYCDTDGKFKQTVYGGNGCTGVGTKQVFDQDHCLYNIKLGSCVVAPSVASTFV
mmetsp:Transcript_56279/g.121269  ORF Transcript_56279/g.121269 Transcript_56279/m.121269 type:complete len:214 (-) Transcript_56279:59-700(-)